MSVEDLRTFFARLESDESLQEEARALDAGADEERLAGLCRLAAREGLEVTPEDWRHESVGPAVAALDDERLRDVVGAGCDEGAGALGVQGSLGAGAGGCGQSLGLTQGGCGPSLGKGAGHCG
jgi:hypothetical protein